MSEEHYGKKSSEGTIGKISVRFFKVRISDWGKTGKWANKLIGVFSIQHTLQTLIVHLLLLIFFLIILPILFVVFFIRFLLVTLSLSLLIFRPPLLTTMERRPSAQRLGRSSMIWWTRMSKWSDCILETPCVTMDICGPTFLIVQSHFGGRNSYMKFTRLS